MPGTCTSARPVDDGFLETMNAPQHTGHASNALSLNADAELLCDIQHGKVTAALRTRTRQLHTFMLYVCVVSREQQRAAGSSRYRYMTVLHHLCLVNAKV